jgi:hypothetical protein
MKNLISDRRSRILKYGSGRILPGHFVDIEKKVVKSVVNINFYTILNFFLTFFLSSMDSKNPDLGGQSIADPPDPDPGPQH